MWFFQLVLTGGTTREPQIVLMFITAWQMIASELPAWIYLISYPFLCSQNEEVTIWKWNFFVPIINDPFTNLAMALFFKGQVDKHGFDLLYRFYARKVIQLRYPIDQAKHFIAFMPVKNNISR
jgi:hypothetical protein